MTLHNYPYVNLYITVNPILPVRLEWKPANIYYATKYIRLPELLAELAVARGEGKFKETIKQYQKYTLLILDEWLLIKLSETEARYLLEIIHARHKKVSTIFCSQFAPMGWYNKFPEATVADAILDRIVHDSHNIEIQYIDKEHDRSMREIYGIESQIKK